MTRSLADRFWEKVDRDDVEDCWPWLGFIDKAGYGRIRSEGGRQGESAYAHRVSYEINVGPISTGLVIDHLCETTFCVNPAHLEPVLDSVNRERGHGAHVLKTGKCSRGHDQSVHGYRSPKGKTDCRECRKLRRAGLAKITEKQHQRAVLDMLKVLQWRASHFRPGQTQQGWRTPVQADGEGYPDITAVRDRVLFLELKTEKGKLSDAQVTWICVLKKAGAEIYVVRPRHLDALAWVLRKRYRPRPGDNPHGDVLLDEVDSVLGMR